MKHVVTMKAKMALIGDNGVGKTSLIRRFVHNEFDDKYIRTLGTKVSKIELVVNHGSDVEVRVILSIFDIMGQTGFRDVVKETFFHGCQGLLAVCDITKKSTLDALQSWISAATDVCGEVPIIIIVNKKDLVRSSVISEANIEKVATIYQCSYAFTSAKTGELVEDAFNALAVQIVEEAFKQFNARRKIDDLKERILDALVRRGQLGFNKLDLFQIFKGLSYDEIEKELKALEREGLVKMSWRGPADFTVVATSSAERVVESAEELPTML